MFKYAALIALALLASDTGSKSTFAISRFTINNDSSTSIVYSGHNRKIDLLECEIEWHNGESIYVVDLAADGIFAIQKSEYDSLVTKYKDENLVANKLYENRKICLIDFKDNS